MFMEHAQPAQPACAPGASRAAGQQGAAGRSLMWYMWRGQLQVGAEEVGSVTLWSEHVTRIPAIGEILKMTRIAKYEDLWHKVLQSQPCQLSQRRDVTIRGRRVTVHSLTSHSKDFQRLVQELTQTPKPQLLTCQLLNEQHNVEVVLVPHCPELEQWGLHGYVTQMLHVVFVCRAAHPRITSLHTLRDVVDLSQACIIDPLARRQSVEKAGVQSVGESGVPEGEGGAREAVSCHSKSLTLTANTNELAEETRPDIHGAASLPSGDSVAKVSDNGHDSTSTGSASVNAGADQSTYTGTKTNENHAEESRSEATEGLGVLVAQSKAEIACDSEVQQIDEPAQQIKTRLPEHVNNDKPGVECMVEDGGLKEFVGGTEENQRVNENVSTTDTPKADHCETLQGPEENLDKNTECRRSKKRRKSKKWNIRRFIKTHKPLRTKRDRQKRKRRKLLSKGLNVSDCPLPQTPPHDKTFYSDDKLLKEVKVVVKKLSLTKLFSEAKEMMGRHIKVPKLHKVDKSSMLDTKKLKDLFSLGDSSKPDLIKPSMLKRNPVLVNPLFVEYDEARQPQACVTPDILRCLAMNSGGKRKEGSGTEEVNNNQVTATHRVKDSTKKEIFNSMFKRQKTESVDNCSLMDEKENKECKVKHKGPSRVHLKDKKERKSSKSTGDSHSEPSKNKEPAIEVSTCPASEQSQAQEDKCRCPVTEQPPAMKKDPCFKPKQVWRLKNDKQTSLKSNGQFPLYKAATSVKIHQDHDKHAFNGERKSGKKIKCKRKADCEGMEAIDDLHPRKKHCRIKVHSSKECSGEFGRHAQVASGTLAGSGLASAVTCKASEGSGKEGSGCRAEVANVGEESQVTNPSEEQGSTKQQPQLDKGESVQCIEHLASCPPQPHQESNDSKPQAVQNHQGEGNGNKSRHTQDHNHNVYTHKSNHLEPEDTRALASSGQPVAGAAGGCVPAAAGAHRGLASPAEASPCSPPPPGQQPAQPQPSLPHTPLPDATLPLPAVAKEGMQGSCQDTMEAQLSEQGPPPFVTTHCTDAPCGEDICAGQSEAQGGQDPGDHHESNGCMKTCNVTEQGEGRKSSTSIAVTSVHSASVQDSAKVVHGAQGRHCAAHARHRLAEGKVMQPPRAEAQSAKQWASRRLNVSPQRTLTDKHPARDLPCPKLIAKQLQSNMKSCVLNVYSSLSSGLESLNRKYESLPVLQASLAASCRTSPSAPQQSHSLVSPKLLPSVSRLPVVKKVFLESILKKMKLQLLRDANLLSKAGHCPVSSGLKTLTRFIEGQGASPPQCKAVPQALQDLVNAMLESHHLSPLPGRPIIAQSVAELHQPYKLRNSQPLYVATCRTQVKSGVCGSRSPGNFCGETMPPASLRAPGLSSPAPGHCHGLSVPLKPRLPRPAPLPSATPHSMSTQPGRHSHSAGGIDRAVLVPNEAYQPRWEAFPRHAPLDLQGRAKYIHLFQGHPQDVIKIKCLLVAHARKSYGSLGDIQLYGGHVLAHHAMLDQLLATPTMLQLCASSCVSFGVYGCLGHVLEGRVGRLLRGESVLLLLHHTALLDPNTGGVLQAVSSSRLHKVLIPAHTLQTCAVLLSQQPRTTAEEKLREILKQNLYYVMKCVEGGAGHILGGGRGGACMALTPQAPVTAYLAGLRLIHRCLNLAHRHTAVLIGEGLQAAAGGSEPPLYQLCAAQEVAQRFLKAELQGKV